MGKGRNYLQLSFSKSKSIYIDILRAEIFHSPHPHKLVGLHCDITGTYTKQIIYRNGTNISFDDISIQCVKKRDIDTMLERRGILNVHPRIPGFTDVYHTNCDLNSLRLCFQVLIKTGNSNVYNCALPPIVSDTTTDKKSSSGLNIDEVSRDSCIVAGKKKMIILCDKVYCVTGC